MNVDIAPEPRLREAGSIEIEPGFLVTEAGERVAYEIGTLYVPERRGKPDSRMIGVGFARIRAAAPTGAPPNFHLPGGPGSSNLVVLDPHSDAERAKQRELLAYRVAGDVVIVDQRGWSRRGEMLEFAARPHDVPLDRPASLAAAVDAFADAARIAVAANQGRDLAGYTVLECADDVNDLRRALGYEQVILVGQSFGSQWSLAVLRRHPAIVARALLSGVEPLACSYDPAGYIFAALQRLSFDADRDPRLAPWLPAGGLMAAVCAIRDRFADGDPVTVTVEGQAVTLGREDLQQALLRPADAWPAMILSIWHGHYQDWAREVIALRRRSDGTDPLIAPLIDTSLGMTPERAHQLRTDPAAAFLGLWDFDAYAASAAIWPSADVGDDFRRPVLNLTPVVFLCGDWDVFTPIENMLGLLPYFPNGRAILVRRGPHAVRAMLAAENSLVTRAVLEFLRTGNTGGLPVDASLPIPSFKLPDFAAGEEPRS